MCVCVCISWCVVPHKVMWSVCECGVVIVSFCWRDCVNSHSRVKHYIIHTHHPHTHTHTHTPPTHTHTPHTHIHTHHTHTVHPWQFVSLLAQFLIYSSPQNNYMVRIYCWCYCSLRLPSQPECGGVESYCSNLALHLIGRWMWKDTVHSHTLYRPLYLGPPSPPLILGPAVWFSAANSDIRPSSVVQCSQ